VRRFRGSAGCSFRSTRMRCAWTSSRRGGRWWKPLRLTWSCEAGVRDVLVDRSRVFQVLTNLVGNAIKFTPPEGHVQVTARARPEGVCLAVQDSGPGISRTSLPHVFDPFWQAATSSRGSAGLGLAIAKGIIDSHGGRLWVESEEGRGSTFLFTLPLA